MAPRDDPSALAGTPASPPTGTAPAIDPWDPAPPTPPWAGARGRRPLGVTIVALFYVVLGAHAVMFGAYLIVLTPSTAPSLGFASFLTRDPGFVQAYGAALLAIALAFLGNGVALFRERWWARWTTVALAPLHLVGPPFFLGGMLFALAVNVYLWGSGKARTFFEEAQERARGPGLSS